VVLFALFAFFALFTFFARHSFWAGREEIFRAKNAKGAKKTTNTTNHWDTLAGEMEQRVLPRAAGGWWISS
jgi:hypothetical protein